jgi:hypothetical protein
MTLRRVKKRSTRLPLRKIRAADEQTAQSIAELEQRLGKDVYRGAKVK